MKKTAQERFFEAKDKLQGIYRKAKEENRALTDAESTEVAQYRSEMDQAQIEMSIEAGERLAASLSANLPEAQRKQMRANFVKAVCEAAAKGQSTLQLRDSSAAGPVTKSDAQPFVALEIGDIIGPLEKGMVLDKVGCHIQTGLTDDWIYPVVEAIEASIEGETTEVSDSELDINNVKPSPKRVTVSVPVTNTALVMTNDRLYDVVINSLRLAIMRTLNKWMLQPTAVSGQKGLFVECTTIRTCTAFSYKEICDLVGAVDSTGIVPSASAAFIMSNATAAALKATPRNAAGGDRMIIEEGKIDGVPVFVSEYVPVGTIEYGYFNYALIGQFGRELNLVVDPFTLAKKNQVQFTLTSFWDIKQARAQAFGRLSKVSGSGSGNAESA
jgi:HK97 family phage major capsid protein